ncbi:M50 family metallopeptidase [Amycolatopsis suaedae]|uniref:RIP metalloprotease n=1 Tax=Amycolatopsis suaedae TaxID=2510978 RepID=A0A4Q7JAM4_9PSEU|nr:site-2 protease family protein [Amycolatopsis suaedae]RZQ64831.1 RIP metalloprotease [Amycolatopsis suaedae]
MLSYIIGVVLFVIGACLSVAVHEAGHMLTAKAFGMKVRRFFVGFGPKIFSFRRGETEYGLKAIPLGGFCDIAGMTALDEVTEDEKPRAMYRFAAWKRTVVMVAGIALNFVLGFVILYLMAITMGLPNLAAAQEEPKPNIASVSACVRDARTIEENNNPVCRPGDPAPARDAGMLPGDLVTSVGGTPTPTWTDMLAAVQKAEGPTPVQVLRNGQPVDLTINVPRVLRPDGNGGTKQVGAIGAARVMAPRMLDYGPVAAIGGTVSFTGEMFSQTVQKLIEFPQRIPAVVESIFGGERDPETPVSIVGASRIGGEAVEAGLWEVFVLLLASLNFFLGVFNLLPLLPMDGGHIAVVWYEKIRNSIRKARGKGIGAPVDYTKLSSVTMVIVFIGAAVVLLTVTADIVNPIRLLP